MRGRVWSVQGPTGWSVRAVAALLQALVPALLMNVCIVGLNQVFDVRIDRVNKPYLPLASGEFSMQTGVALVRKTHPLLHKLLFVLVSF